MAAYDTLRAAIDNYIKANGNKEITGTVLNDILNAMVSALGADTRFAGVAVPSTNPGNPEGNVVYFASQAGTYSNFGGIVLPLGIHILVWNGTAWTSQTWFSVDNTPTQNSQNLATSGGILQAIVDAVGVERLRAIGAEVTSCSFDSNTKKISFFNSANSTLFQLDATAFVIDGMVSDVKIEDGNLVIQFNTDAGKQDIEIPLTDIFNPANYYTKTAIDALLALYYTKTETDALLTAINNKMADGCLYRGMAEPTANPSTPTTKVFYIATKAGTYTNFGNIAVTEGITILKYDGSNWSKEQISYSDGVFDISAYNGTSYVDLSAALGNGGANIPQNLRKGGMSVKYVQSSDNKYVQYRLMSDMFNTTPTNWQGVDDEPTVGSDNLVKSGGVIDTFVKNNLIYIAGTGGTIATKDVSLAPNKAYTLFIDNPDWTYTGAFQGLLLRMTYNDGTSDVVVDKLGDSSVIDVGTGSTVKKVYKFKTAENITTYTLRLRADVGQTVRFRIEPEGMQASDNKLLFGGNTVLEIDDIPSEFDNYNRVTKSNYLRAIAGYNLAKIDLVPNKLLSIPDSIAIGDTLDVTPVDNNDWRYAIVNCNEGDVFVISCIATGSRRAFCYVDNSNKVVGVYTTSSSPLIVSSVAPANATKLIISDRNSNLVSYKGQNILSRIKEIRNNIVKALKNDGVSITRTSTGYVVKISQIRIRNLESLIIGGVSSTFTFADSNSYLLVDMQTMTYRQENGIANVTNNDIVLLNYTAGIGFTGGLLFDEFVGGELPKLRRADLVAANGIIFNHSSVKWDSLVIKVGNVPYNIPAAEYTFGFDTLIYRPSINEVMQLSTITLLVDGDIVLLYRRNDKFVGGELLGYYNAQIRDIPKDTAHLNVYKKALQQKNLKWTPKATVEDNEGIHTAGVEVTGVPYSSVKEKLKFVGKSVSLHTFMTAVNDVHSLLYTEKVGEDNSQSAYGITYHGVNCCSYYGSVCSSYNSGMLGIDSLLASWRFKMLSANFIPLLNQNEQCIKVGDVLVENGHVLTCIKIEMDSVGNIEYITMAEQAAPIKVEKYTPRTLGNRRKKLNAIWARYNKLYDNTQYVPSPFVLIDNEYLYNVSDVVFIDNQNALGTNTYYWCYTANSDSEFTVAKWREISPFSSSQAYGYGDYCTNIIDGVTSVYRKLGSGSTAKAWDDADWERVPCNEWASVPFTYNNDIVTFAGDRPAFGLADLIYINYNLGGYTAMELFKEDTLIQTIPLSSGYQINITSYINGAGKYRARLKNSGGYSRFTYFEVIDNSVSVSFTNDILNISSNTPSYCFALSPLAGNFSYNEVLDNATALTRTRQQLIACLAADKEEQAESNEALYCRMLFQGEYGQVPSVMTEIMSSYDTGEWSFIHEDENISLGKIAETANVALVGELKGHSYVFDVFTEVPDVSINVVPVKGEIYWLDALPQNLSEGHIYQISIVNGIGSIKTNAQ